jgi:hypothetical protein
MEGENYIFECRQYVVSPGLGWTTLTLIFPISPSIPLGDYAGVLSQTITYGGVYGTGSLSGCNGTLTLTRTPPFWPIVLY